MTTKKRHSAVNWMSLATLGLLLAACGSSDSKTPTAAGQAQTGAAIAGTVTLNDAATPSQSRSAPMAADGTFAVPVAGLTPPYLLRAEWPGADGTTQVLYGVSDGNENVDIDGLSDLAYGSACTEKGRGEADDFDHSNGDGKRDSANKSREVLQRLLDSPLAPLFALYGITDVRHDRAAVRLLLKDVSVTLSRHDGIVTVTNRATGGVIFVGELRNLDAGVYTAANLPAGPGGGVTCTAFTYADFGACQADGTQSRTMLTSLPAGCTGGAPVLTQTCTFVPPANTCTSFTYSAFGACQADSTQSRTVLTSLPAGCTGGAPVLTQACTFVPPANTCTSFTYSAFGACQADSTQSRTVLTSLPAGCTGGAPVLTQACTFVPPANTCTSFTYSAFGACQADSTQSRTVLTSLPAGCTGGAPVLTQACTFVPPVNTCTSFTYTAFGACQASNTQSRTVLTSLPAGCTGGTPVLTQACTFVPPIDGAALYTQLCAGCHGTSKKGRTAAAIQGAIDANVGGMGSAALRALTPAQVAAISASP